MSVASEIDIQRQLITNAYNKLDDLGVNLYKLPVDYTQLEYIESTGTQYIDTGYVINTNCSAKYGFMITGTVSNGHAIAGVFNGDNDLYFGIVRSANSKLSYRYKNNFYASNTTIIKDTLYDVETSLKKSNQFLKLNNIEEINSSVSSDFTNDLTSFIFSINGLSAYYMIGRIYYFKIHDNDVLVRDFIPCKRNSDNEVGLYDLVNNVFYTNQGTGTFTAGEEAKETIDKNINNIASLLDTVYEEYPKVTGTGTEITLDGTKVGKLSLDVKGNSIQTTRLLPDSYTQLEYIESTGTQYINTNYTPVQGDDFEFKNVKINGNGALFGAGTGDYDIILLYQSPTYYYRCFSSGSAQSFTISVPVTNIKIINGALYFNDTIKTSTTYGGAVNTPLYIFNRANLTSIIKAQIGEVIITNNNTKKHHYVPCKRNSDNAIGMYDIVGNTFLTNAGTGTFSYGNLPTPNYPVPIYSVGDENLFDGEITTGSIISSTGTLSPNALGWYSTNFYPVKPNTTYKVSYNSTDYTFGMRVAQYTENKTFSTRPVTNSSPYTFTTGNDIYFIKLSGGTGDSNIQLKATVGSISEKIVNKNLCNTIMTVNLTSGNERWRAISLNTENSGIIWEQGKTYYICAFLDKQSNETVQITNYGYASIDNRVVNITFNGAIPYVRVGANTLNGNVVNEEVKIMVATSTFTDYAAHQEQTYTIPVQQPMKSLKTVRDEIPKGLNIERHNIGTTIYTGASSEAWQYYQGIVFIDNSNIKAYPENGGMLLTNYFTPPACYIAHTTRQRLHINLTNAGLSDITSVSAWKTWLSTHNLVFQFELAIPTDLPCTAEQIAILENLPKSYNEQTNIYSLDVTPAYIEAKALKGE